MSPSLLHQQRVSVAASMVVGGSGGLDLTLALADHGSRAKIDPAMPAHIGPLCTWAEAVWASWIPSQTLQKLMDFTSKRVQILWGGVTGPAAAVFLTAQRIGWKFESYRRVLTEDGDTLDFLLDSPAMIKLIVTQAVEKWRNHRIELTFPSLGSANGNFGPHIGPIARLLDPKKVSPQWTAQLQGALRSVVVNRQWPQYRLHQIDSCQQPPTCQLCVAAGLCDPWDTSEAFRGTLLHRACLCQVLAPFREAFMPSEIRTQLQRALSRGTPLSGAEVLWFTRGIRKSPFARLPQREKNEGTFEWVMAPQDDGPFCGLVYTDGSLCDGDALFEGHCLALGWSFVALDEDGEIVASAHGTPPWWVSTIYGAELWAIQMVVARIVPGMARALSDCQTVQRDCSRGLVWA